MARHSMAWPGTAQHGKEGTACWPSPSRKPFSCAMRTNALDADKGEA